MKDKLLFWIDFGFIHFGIAKAIQENFDSEIYSIIDINDKAKKFFQSQNIVNFKKAWYYLDEIEGWKDSTIDIEYLKNFEKKYNINLWNIAFTDRAFFRYNNYYNFSHNEVLSILEKECKFYEKVISEIKPDFLLLWVTNAHNTHLLHQMCQASNVKILTFSQTRFGNRFMISPNFDKFDKLDLKNTDQGFKMSEKELSDFLHRYDPSKIVKKKGKVGYESHRSSRYNALFKFFLSKPDESYKNRYSYYGRTKYALLKEKIHRKTQKGKRERFIDQNFIRKINSEYPFIYFPLHSEPERSLLIGAPYHDDQFSTILYVAKSLPVGYKLYVKDHPAMKKFVWRPILYYQDLLNIPNIEFLHPSVGRDEILNKCSLVVTIGGTTALEAAFFNKPALIFQENDLPMIPSIRKINNVKDLPEFIRTALKEKVDVSAISNYLKIINSNSFEIDMISLNTDFAYTFGFKGPNIDGELPNEKVIKFLKKHKDTFDTIGSEHIKKIENYKKLN